MDKREQTVVILGATGFIGRNLCQMLYSDYNLIAIVNPKSCNKNKIATDERIYKKIEIVEYDLFSPASSLRLSDYIVSCDVAVFFAWRGMEAGNRGDFRIHFECAEMLLKHLKELSDKFPACKFIIAGTQAEYGLYKDKIVNENTACNPVTSYGKAKLQFYSNAMEYVNRRQQTLIELRLHSVFGEGEKLNKMLPSVIYRLKGGGQADLDSACKQIWDFLYVTDVCKAIGICIAQDLPSGAYNLSSGEMKRLKDYLIDISMAMYGENFINFGKQNDNMAPNFLFDSTKFRTVAGWKPETSFIDGVFKVVESMFKGCV